MYCGILKVFANEKYYMLIHKNRIEIFAALRINM